VDRRLKTQASCETVCDTARRLEKEVNGNGQPGLRQEIQKVREELAAMRGAADARFKYTQILLAALTIAVALMAIPRIADAIHTGKIHFPILSISAPLESATITHTQSAGNESRMP